MEVPIFSYKISFDTRPLGRKGILHLKFGSGSDIVIPNLDAAQIAAVATILEGPSPSYDPDSQTVSSIRIVRVPGAADIADLIANPAVEHGFQIIRGERNDSSHNQDNNGESNG